MYPSGGPVHIHTHMPDFVPNRAPDIVGFTSSKVLLVKYANIQQHEVSHLELTALARIKQAPIKATHEYSPKVYLLIRENNKFAVG